MPYTISSNASVGVHSSVHETASDALAAAFELAATGHQTIHIANGQGLPLTLAGLEDQVRRDQSRALSTP